MFAESKTAQFLTKIDSDLFNQDLFLISNCEVELEVRRLIWQESYFS